jgi:hypothetical protein
MKTITFIELKTALEKKLGREMKDEEIVGYLEDAKRQNDIEIIKACISGILPRNLEDLINEKKKKKN